jgi:hypothetical protein
MALTLGAGIGGAGFALTGRITEPNPQTAAASGWLYQGQAQLVAYKGCSFQSELGSWRVKVDGRTIYAQPIFQWDVPRAVRDHQAYLYCVVESAAQPRGTIGFCRTDRSDPVCDSIKTQKPQ